MSTPEVVQKMKEYLSNVDYKVHKEIIINLLTDQRRGVKNLEDQIVAEYEKILDDGGYILEGYDSLWVDMSQLVEDGHPNALIRDILVIQEFPSMTNLLYSVILG